MSISQCSTLHTNYRCHLLSHTKNLTTIRYGSVAHAVTKYALYKVMVYQLLLHKPVKKAKAKKEDSLNVLKEL